MVSDAFIPLGQVPATANRLQRTAGELRQQAGSPDAVPSLPVTLTHLDDALDQLAASMRQMAEAAAEWCGEDGATASEDRLKPEARALLWHLRLVADTLSESRDACNATREWAERMLENPATETHDPCMALTNGRGVRASAVSRRSAAERMDGRVHGTVSAARS
jgi:hypothetical protein